MKKLVVSLVLVMASIAAFSQQGFIRGKVTDGETGEMLTGASIVIGGTTIGASSDFDGNYSIPAAPGIYTIVVSFVSFQTQTIENVQVKKGQVTNVNFVLKSDAEQLGEVVVTAQAMRDSEVGLMTFQQRSANVLDGVSSQTFRKTGDRDLASAIKRVTGVSVQGGKFVYVRGLGDRYTRTTLNGMTIPGLDPDRNDVQIDIFPTSILENVIVYKTSSPNLPGDFTGGIVDVEMKNFPEEKITSVSLGFGYNPNMNLKDDFISHQGGKTDWLGFDDGFRALPFSPDTKTPDVSLNDHKLESLTRSLNPQLGTERKRSFLNTTFSFNHGNQINKENHTLGYTAIFNYRRQFEHNNNVEYGEYTKDDDVSETSLFKEEIRRGTLSRTSVLWSGLLSGSIKFDRHQLTASIFRTQNGTSENSERTSINFDQTQATLYENILTYSQRSVTNALLSGTHQFNKLKAEWKNSFTIARTYDPDYRETAISITNPSQPTLNRGDGAKIQRFWRDLNEFNENLKLDFTLPYGKSNKLQFGAMGVYKDRSFEVFNYMIDYTDRSNVPLDPDFFLQPENIWTADSDFGSYLEGNKEKQNNFDATSGVYSAYLMTEMTLGKVKAIYGVRAEKADMRYTGIDSRNVTYNNVRTFDELNFLPSVNLVYSFTDKMNVRGSFGQTLARPSFKEKSAAQIYDGITKRFFNGNLDLEQTLINNYDFRWENFLGGSDMISVSLFYKQFDGHIELVTYDVAPNNVRPRNSGSSNVYGVEFEFRKSLAFIQSALSGFTLGSNVTFANSEVNLNSVIINESGLTEYDSRKLNARTNEKIKSTRQMGGQSPYLVNAFLNYTNAEGLFNANLSYNVQGESLFIVGVGAIPDIYTQPFHSLNFNVYRDFGRDHSHRITLRADNMLNSTRKDLYRGYGDAEAIYSIFNPGRSFSLTYGLTF